MLPHCLNQIDSPHNVVCIIQHWKLNALSNRFTPSKMDDSIKSATTLNYSMGYHITVAQELIQTYFSAANSLSTSSKCLKSPCEAVLTFGHCTSKHALQHLSHLDKCHVFALVTSKFLHPGISDLKCVVQIVDDGYPTAVIQQAEDCMTACTRETCLDSQCTSRIGSQVSYT